MYNQFLDEARAAQYRQQCEREAAIERSLRLSRQAQQGNPAVAPAPARPVFGAIWLQIIARFISQSRIVAPR